MNRVFRVHSGLSSFELWNCRDIKIKGWCQNKAVWTLRKDIWKFSFFFFWIIFITTPIKFWKTWLLCTKQTQIEQTNKQINMWPLMPKVGVSGSSYSRAGGLSCFSRSGTRFISSCSPVLQSIPLWAMENFCEMMGRGTVNLLDTWGLEITLTKGAEQQGPRKPWTFTFLYFSSSIPSRG